MQHRYRKIFRWVKIVLLVYGLVGLLLYYGQEYLLFHPVKVDRSTPWKFDQPFEEVDIAFSSTDTMNLVKFFPADTVRRGVVLFFHGNRENIARYARFAPFYTRHGYEVWIHDYPGYGKSVGERNETILYRQAEQLYLMASGKYGADSIIIVGKSFGTGPAAYLASVNKARWLMLETPYYSIPDLFSCFIPIYPAEQMANYRLPVNEFLPDVQCPVTIFLGTGDWVTPYRCSRKLQSSLKPADAFITIEGGTHHNLNTYPVFRQHLDSMLTLP
jgi:alpha-beta hydrolase superfamily lysophospholipase